ncbi:MAG: tRNA (adenosine(37)-N6)-threonylcarbamoyltransferase complex ATPase subunit type 1 TsaE [Rhodospirillaceae bacterium]|nr:tRNA (adenosine(37)-N6)-threonylcarbamoyltransferase complex ATPase subunit type 1 TsaE [Rhodospirillaceae bacterium]HAA91884.1 tRNA (adenosine(37)-N6)-threonylcarbamoyltransferase complex ATPase subunit type 1 TsaE [Rhodospirillaceae bacterium]
MIDLADEAASEAFASRIADLAVAGDVIGLSGSLGVGKTVFARAFIRSLVDSGETVPSPTYTLMQLYDSGPVPIYHYDLYRIESDDELDELGFEEALADGIALIEWPERVGGLGGMSRLDLAFSEKDSAQPNQRQVTLLPGAAWHSRLKDEFSEFAGALDV